MVANKEGCWHRKEGLQGDGHVCWPGGVLKCAILEKDCECLKVKEGATSKNGPEQAE